MSGKKVIFFAINFVMPFSASIIAASIVLAVKGNADWIGNEQVQKEMHNDSFKDSSNIFNATTFEGKFNEQFPSLKGKVQIESTDSEYIWKVSMDGKSLYFPHDLTYAIEGEVMLFPSSKSNSVSQKLTSKSLAETSEQKIDTLKLEKEPIPPRHVGLIRAEYAEGLATVNKDLLPYYQATKNRDDENPRYLITFVDSTCPACKRFIQQIPAINSLGIDVYLAPFARNGAHTKTAKLMTTVWCDSNNDRRLENIVKKKKGAILQSECADKLYLNNINASLSFGDGFLNQTTPVSFTNNGVIVIANLDPNGFDEAFSFGDKFAEYVASNIIGKE